MENIDSIPSLELGTEHFKEANEKIRALLDQNDEICLRDVFAQRYIGCAMPQGKSIKIHGTPGNDMAAYMDGGNIEVFGNAQDQIGNTMNAGNVVIHGRCGDAAGYAMRGGHIFIRDDCGWRVGIHMKQFEDKKPVIVIGGNAGSFLGEYMAGGAIVLLGCPGEYMATGMHGGVIYLKHKPEEIGTGLVIQDLDDEDDKFLENIIDEYNNYFDKELDNPIEYDRHAFVKLRPESSRPYADMYAH